ncbi:peptidylprolyl isomerase [Rhodopseudomonas faecalis]|nr:peptidylprolyl isomerase [Rhodopseudomonas faecalis]
MLRGIRNASSNWIGKTIMSAVMGVLILSFAVWGIADIFKGFGQSTLAKIGSTEISTEQFRQLYTERLQQIGRQFGKPLTSDQARAFGIDRQVLQQAVAEAALDEDARRRGLGQSDAETMRTILTDPSFKGANGSFDQGRFIQLLRQFGYSEARYIAEQRKVSLRRQIAGTLTSGLAPSATLLDALIRYQNEQRSIDYVKLGQGQAGTIEPPSAETLAAYYADHKNQFRAPEYRKVSFLVLTPAEFAKTITVSDEDAKKVFEQQRDKFSTPEKRQVWQIVFPSADDAKAARAKIAEGTSFEDIAKDRGFSAADIDLGLVTKAGILDPAVASAAFTLGSGEVSQPVTGRFGTALVKVGKIEAGSAPSFDSVVADLKRDVAVDRARAAIADLHNQIEDARGGGSSITEVAQKLGLKAVTIEAMDRSGRSPEGTPVSIPQGLELTPAVFASDVGVDNDAISFGGGYVWFDVSGVTPSRERSLDEVKAQVEARWRDEQVGRKLSSLAAEMVQKLNGGTSMADAAAAAGLKVEQATGFKRDATLPGVPASVVQAAFRTAKDGSGQAPASAGGEWIVFRVTDISVPPVDANAAENQQLKENLERRLDDELLAQYVAKLEGDLGTSINDAAVAQATGAAAAN